MPRKYTIKDPAERERRRLRMVEINQRSDFSKRVAHMNEINRKRNEEKKSREQQLQERVNFLEDLCKRHGLDFYLQ